MGQDASSAREGEQPARHDIDGEDQHANKEVKNEKKYRMKKDEETQIKIWKEVCAAAKANGRGFTMEELETLLLLPSSRGAKEEIFRQRVAKHFEEFGDRTQELYWEKHGKLGDNRWMKTAEVIWMTMKMVMR